MWLLYTSPRLFVAFHDCSVLAALTDASLNEVFDGGKNNGQSFVESIRVQVCFPLTCASSLHFTQTHSTSLFSALEMEDKCTFFSGPLASFSILFTTLLSLKEKFIWRHKFHLYQEVMQWLVSDRTAKAGRLWKWASFTGIKKHLLICVEFIFFFFL